MVDCFIFVPIYGRILQTWITIFLTLFCDICAWLAVSHPPPPVKVDSYMALVLSWSILPPLPWWCMLLYLKLVLYFIFYWEYIFFVTLLVLYYFFFIGLHPCTFCGIFLRCLLSCHPLHWCGFYFDSRICCIVYSWNFSGLHFEIQCKVG